MPRRSAASFFSALVEINKPGKALEKASKHNLNNLMQEQSPSILAVVFRLVGGECARSELEVLADPLRRYVVNLPMLFKNISREAMKEESGVLTRQALEATTLEQRLRFIAQLDVLRGGRKSNEVVKDFWVACRENDKVTAAEDFNEEVHVVAGAAVGRLADLEGKPVATGQPGSTAESAARDLFEAAGVSPRPVAASGPEALARLRSGEIAAFVTVSGRPAAELAGIGPMENLRLIPVPFAPRLQAEYYPASLVASDYPGLIPEGERVDTLAAGTVLVAPAGPEGGERQRRAAALVESFFRNLPDLARSGHPKWREVNLGALLPDWPRFEPARRWLAAHPAPAQAPAVSSLRLDEVPR
ncbi:MAG: hypothetical protein M1823_006525 [Watsoniomyces obsoletus]|nr:MAG: hypothetical protein M1823_006525 [Watsoniomyces obsoletus]